MRGNAGVGAMQGVGRFRGVGRFGGRGGAIRGRVRVRLGVRVRPRVRVRVTSIFLTLAGQVGLRQITLRAMGTRFELPWKEQMNLTPQRDGSPFFSML